MKAVVLEIKEKNAAVLMEDGIMKLIPDRSYSVGQEINTEAEICSLSRRPVLRANSFAKAAACAALAVIVGSGIFYASETAFAYSTVSLDTDNVSIELILNKKDQVIGVEMKESGEEFSALTEDLISARTPVSEAVKAVSVLINEEPEISVDSKDAARKERLMDEARNSVPEMDTQTEESAPGTTVPENGGADSNEKPGAGQDAPADEPAAPYSANGQIPADGQVSAAGQDAFGQQPGNAQQNIGSADNYGTAGISAQTMGKDLGVKSENVQNGAQSENMQNEAQPADMPADAQDAGADKANIADNAQQNDQAAPDLGSQEKQADTSENIQQNDQDAPSEMNKEARDEAFEGSQQKEQTPPGDNNSREGQGGGPGEMQMH